MLAKSLKCKGTCARNEGLRCDKGVSGMGSTGRAILVLGLIVLFAPCAEAGRTEEMVAVGMLGVDGGNLHTDVAVSGGRAADAGCDAFHRLWLWL